MSAVVFTSSIYVPTDSYYYPTLKSVELVKVLVVIILHYCNVILLDMTPATEQQQQELVIL